MRSASDETSSLAQEPQRYSGKPWFALWLTGFFERDLNFYLQTMEKGISLAALPPPESLAMTNYWNSAAPSRRKDFIFVRNFCYGAFKSNCSRGHSPGKHQARRDRVCSGTFRLAKGRCRMHSPNSRRSISMPFQPILSTANRSDTDSCLADTSFTVLAPMGR